MNSRSVVAGVPVMTVLSHLVNPSGLGVTSHISMSLMAFFALPGASGAIMRYELRPRLLLLSRNESRSVLPPTTLYISSITRPVTAAVVVAMAGMILPAIILALWRVASGIL